jgi:hypothetical protein
VAHGRQRVVDAPHSLDDASALGIDGRDQMQESHSREARGGKISSLGYRNTRSA